jgi:cytochrome c peroxidase
MNFKSFCTALILLVIIVVAGSFNKKEGNNNYQTLYFEELDSLDLSLRTLDALIVSSDLTQSNTIENIDQQISTCRQWLKSMDFWLRYLEPVSYKKINGPLPVEWETEVFEKLEKPYKREGAGLSLAEQYLGEKNISLDSLQSLIHAALPAINTYRADTVVRPLGSFQHFFFCNRLYLLNLAAIYTTGFDCPDKKQVIPELKKMMTDVKAIYFFYNSSYPAKQLSREYLDLYGKAIQFVSSQPQDIGQFDHFTFIRDFINPLFAMNQSCILTFQAASKSFNDFSLNNDCNSIFSKSLYRGQNAKGSYYMVKDEEMLSEIKKTGKLLFYDPLLSKNNLRSCASCHKPTEYFTDTTRSSPPQFSRDLSLARNTPSLINVPFNHLLMLDGKHTTLLDQVKDVTSNSVEMGSSEKEIMEKVLSCKEYKAAFKKYLALVTGEKEITFSQVVSAIILYYNDFSFYDAGFDDMMNGKAAADSDVKTGFNLFMGKAQCGTCHFVPQFNGVKPPYVSSEFEVLGVPVDLTFKNVSTDSGRYFVNAAPEMLHAFRTGSLRNIVHTKPYGHNGVFATLDEVLDFYDAGGGAGKGLRIENQTLSSDSLHLTEGEKKSLIAFMKSLDEKIIFEAPPGKLPVSSRKELNNRIPGGVY